jgi:glyoxylase-like metal-dependent hydrolase (beta-lactamase superfamily II)
MLRWKQIGENFLSISVGKEYNGEPYYWTTFYYYKGLLLDTGCPHTAEESVRFIEDMKLSIEAVLITHYHEDHSGGAHLFKERFDVDVFAPRESLEILTNPPEIPEYRQTVWGQPKPVDANPTEREMKFNRAVVNTFKTPGHSFDHVSFLTEKVFFIGDLVTNPAPVIVKKEEDYVDLIGSLKRVVNLNFETAYGGHGFWDKNTIKVTLSNLLKLKETVCALHGKGLGVEQIVERMFSNVPDKVPLMEEMSEYEWSRKNLVESILGMMHKPRVVAKDYEGTV